MANKGTAALSYLEVAAWFLLAVPLLNSESVHTHDQPGVFSLACVLYCLPIETANHFELSFSVF